MSIKINEVSNAKICNVCRAILFLNNTLERCENCVSLYGETGIVPLKKAEGDTAPALKQLESIEWERKRELLENPNTRKSYDECLTKCIHNIWGYDYASINRMTFEAREESAKIIYEAIIKSNFSARIQVLIICLVQVVVSLVVFGLGFTNIQGFIIEVIIGSVATLLLLFGLYYGHFKKKNKIEMACLYAVGFKDEYEKFH